MQNNNNYTNKAQVTASLNTCASGGMKYGLMLCIAFFIFFSCQEKPKNGYITISVKLDVDSTELGFFDISIFKKGFTVKDTFGNFEGNFTLCNKDKIDGVIIRYSGCHPVYKSIEEISNESIIFLKSSALLMNTGGMGTDTVLLEINDILEKKINDWNKDNQAKN